MRLAKFTSALATWLGLSRSAIFAKTARTEAVSVAAMLAVGLVLAPVSGACADQSEIDSTKIPRAGLLPDSNCANIDGIWYSPGQLPPGFYKSLADGMCYPIPDCGTGTWTDPPQVCVYPPPPPPPSTPPSTPASPPPSTPPAAGTPPTLSFSVGPRFQTAGASFTADWAASSADPVNVTASCAGALVGSWALPANGSGDIPANEGATTCSAQATNAYGSVSVTAPTVYACPAGKTWNGSFCAAPVGPTISLSLSPNPAIIGTNNFTAVWSTTGSGVSVSGSCTGANGAGAYPSMGASGSTQISVTAPGSTSCTVVATDSNGLSASANASANAACPAGKSWNGSACTSPVIAGPVISFSLSPGTAVIGTNNLSASWSTTGTDVSVSAICTGANGAGTYSALGAFGSAQISVTAPGSTTCTATATNAAGSASTTASAMAVCPPTTTWNGSSCVIQSPSPTGGYCEAEQFGWTLAWEVGESVDAATMSQGAAPQGISVGSAPFYGLWTSGIDGNHRTSFTCTGYGGAMCETVRQPSQYPAWPNVSWYAIGCK